jgi:hypothetical protein
MFRTCFPEAVVSDSDMEVESQDDSTGVVIEHGAKTQKMSGKEVIHIVMEITLPLINCNFFGPRTCLLQEGEQCNGNNLNPGLLFICS